MGRVPVQVIEDYGDFPLGRASAVCLGNFDGVHKGHQQIFRKCFEEAKHHNLIPTVFTFKPHPMKFIRQENKPLLLVPYDEKVGLLKEMGFEIILVQNFSETFSKMSARDFAEEVLANKLQAKHIIVGPNFTFGYKAQGNVDYLKSLKEFSVDVLSPMESDGKPISSSWVRELVAGGEIEKANELLGHPYYMVGEVVKGASRGESMGFPTVNLEAETEALPKKGVYASVVQDDESGHFYCGASNIGTNPTFESGQKLQIETHLIHFEDDLYGKRLRVFLLKRIRDEMKFSGAKDLAKQIQIDLQNCQNHFADMQLFQKRATGKKLTLKSVDALTQSFQPFKIFKELM